MVIGEVIGTIISTRKHESLTGSKFLIVKCMLQMGGDTLVAIDNVGAGIGDIVLVATGSAARVQTPNAPIDALIVGIVDDASKIVFH